MSSLQRSDTTRPLSAILGPETHRYFGAGYKGVTYDIDLDSQELGPDGLVRVKVTANYPTHWSHDSGGAPRVAHLSSVDAIALPLVALERTRGLSRLSDYWVSRVEIRAPRAPVILLVGMQLELSVVGTPGASDMIEVIADVSGMRTRLRLRRGREACRLRDPEPAGARDSVYSTGFRHVAIDSWLEDHADGAPVLAAHAFAAADDGPSVPMQGIESSFSPSASVIDLLVTVGQMNQAAIYAPLPVSARRGELWLRSMTIERDQPPLPLPTVANSATRILRDRLHIRGQQRLHDLGTQCVIENMAAVRATLAYIEPLAASEKDC